MKVLQVVRGNSVCIVSRTITFSASSSNVVVIISNLGVAIMSPVVQ